MQTFKYKGHQYRLAAELTEDQPAEPEAEETPEKPAQQPCGRPDSSDPAVVAAEAVLSSSGLEGSVVQVCTEQDGQDVKVDIGQKWSGIEAILTFDYSGDQQLQELVLKMCGLDFVAHGNKMYKLLLQALLTLQKAKFGPQVATDQVEDKKKSEYIAFLQHYIAELVQGAVELDYENREKFAEQIVQLAEQGKYPSDRASVLSEGALRLDDKDWKANIMPLVKSRGQQHATTQELVNKAVVALIPSGEDYTGAAQVVRYLDEGEILVKIDVPKPAQNFMFVFLHQPGSTELKLQDAGLGMCDATFHSGPDASLVSALITSMVNLAILNGRTAQPELSRPPDLVAKEWDKEKLHAALAKGLVIWYGNNDYVRLTWLGKSVNCWSKDDWEKYQVGTTPSTLWNAVERAEKNKREILQVDKDNHADRLDSQLNVIQKDIGLVGDTIKACEVK